MNRAEIIRAAGLDPKRVVCHSKCMDHRDRKPCDCYPGYSADAQDGAERHTMTDHATAPTGVVSSNQLGGSGPLAGKYGNVLGPFLALMEAELHANSRKGDRPGWLSMTPEVGLLEIYWHTAKLSAAVKNRDAALIREHSADVANMAMMLLDVCVGLAVQPNAGVEPVTPATEE